MLWHVLVWPHLLTSHRTIWPASFSLLMLLLDFCFLILHSLVLRPLVQSPSFWNLAFLVFLGAALFGVGSFVTLWIATCFSLRVSSFQILSLGSLLWFWCWLLLLLGLKRFYILSGKRLIMILLILWSEDWDVVVFRAWRAVVDGVLGYIGLVLTTDLWLHLRLHNEYHVGQLFDLGLQRLHIIR